MKSSKQLGLVGIGPDGGTSDSFKQGHSSHRTIRFSLYFFTNHRVDLTRSQPAAAGALYENIGPDSNRQTGKYSDEPDRHPDSFLPSKFFFQKKKTLSKKKLTASLSPGGAETGGLRTCSSRSIYDICVARSHLKV